MVSFEIAVDSERNDVTIFVVAYSVAELFIHKSHKIQPLIVHVCPAISQGDTIKIVCIVLDGESADTNCQYNAEALPIVLVPMLEALNLKLEPKLVFSRGLIQILWDYEILCN